MKDINARECLCEALCRLAQDTPVENISVSRLAERAGVSRAAFYYHFESTCAVLEYMMDSFSREYQRLFIATPGESMDGITPERHREIEHAIFSYVLPRAEWVKLFLQEWNYRRFIGRFREQFQTFCQMHRVMCVLPDGTEEPLQRGVVYDYFVRTTGEELFAYLEYWAERGFVETEEDFIRIFHTLQTRRIVLRRIP